MSFRSKPVGWQYESQRHSLAAKGMTRKYLSPFVEKTTVPVIDYPEEFHSIKQKSVVRMSPDEFLRLAKLTSEHSEHQRDTGEQKIREMSQEEYERSVRNERAVQRVKDGLEKGDDIPAGYIEYAADGGPAEHEGRNRALAARDLGMKEIPVVLVRTRRYEPSKGGGMGHWVYEDDEEYGDHRKVAPFNKRGYMAEKRLPPEGLPELVRTEHGMAEYAYDMGYTDDFGRPAALHMYQVPMPDGRKSTVSYETLLKKYKVGDEQ